jgi:hypothetical protein
VNGAVIETAEHGESKTLFTDVFVYRHGNWQAVSAQELPLTGSINYPRSSPLPLSTGFDRQFLRLGT